MIKKMCFTTLFVLLGVLYSYAQNPSCYINGYEYVDLGLSVKWAAYNIGASAPEGFGDYFAWGESATKASYTTETSTTYGKEITNATTYVCDYSPAYKDDNSGDKPILKIRGNRIVAKNVSGTKGSNTHSKNELGEKKVKYATYYDVATAKWADTWRLPTATEIDELVNRCTWVWSNLEGNNGYLVTGPNGNSIFFPAAGFRKENSLNSANEVGYYWSATPDDGAGNFNAFYLGFRNERFGRHRGNRHYGLPVRAVSE